MELCKILKKNKKILIVTTLCLVLILFSLYKIKHHTITFLVNNKSYFIIDNIKTNEKVKKPDPPIIEGYTFDAWYLDNEEYDFSIPIKSDIKLEAKFYKNKYDVKIDSKNGYITNKKVNHGKTIPEPSIPYKEGYTFLGWFVNSQEYDFNTKITNNILIEAKWSKNTHAKYTVMHYLMNKDGSYNDEPFEKEVLTGKLGVFITPKVKTYIGYTSPETETIKIDMDNSTVIKYFYKINKYKIRIKGDKGVMRTAGDGTYFYNDEVFITYNLNPGYKINKFSEDVVNDIYIVKDKDTEIVITTISSTETPYRVEHYLMDLDGKYKETPSYVDNLVGVTDTIISPKPNDYYGFKSPKSKTININGDGTSVLKYHYERNKYDITLKGDNGIKSLTGSGKYFFEEEIDISLSLKKGYSFDKWSSGETDTNIVHKVKEDLTIYAKTSPIKYKINYNLNGGTVNGTNLEEFTVETDTFEIINPTKTGYTFVGWSDGEKTYDKYVVNKGTIKDINLEAIYTPNTDTQYRVEHYLMDFNGNYTIKHNIETLTGTTNETIIPRVKNIEGFTSPTPKQLIIKPDGTSTIRYEYERNKYLVTIEKDHTISEITNSGHYYYGETIILNATPYKGHSFIKWTKDGELLSNNNSFTYLVESKNVTIKAHGITNTYNIVFDSKGGTKINTFSNYYGGTITKPEDPEKEGYIFTGWYTESECISLFDFNSKITDKDIILYAGWKVKNSTIGFNTYGGSYIEPITGEYGTVVLPPEEPKKLGYTFYDWYVDENYTIPYKFTTIPANGLTLHAKWLANTYTVFFNENSENVEGNMESQKFKYDTSQKISKNNFIKKGYALAGWSLTADGPVKYIDEEKVINLIDKGIVNLYAVWELEKYDINYKLNGGTVNGNNKKQYTIKTETFEIINPTKTGYTFVGWSDGVKTTKKYVVNKGTIEDINLEAIYEINTYKITYNLNGGTVNGTNLEEFTVETDTFEIINPTKTGYTFVGWSDGVKTYDKYVVNKGTIEDINLEAIFTPNTDTIYTVKYYLMDKYGNFGEDATKIETRYGTSDETVIVDLSSYDGFKTPVPIQTKINPDGKTVVEYKYERNKYTVEINKSTGVSSVTGEGTYYFEEEVNIKVEYKEGYEFDNWSNGIETSDFVYKVPSKNETLKINAKPITYSIKYNLNGGIVTGTNLEEYTVETDTFEIINPTKTGYTFVGWSDGVKTYDKYVVNKGITKDINLEAIYEINTYKITYNLNGGIVNGVNRDEYTVETETFEIINPTKTGYTFVGWSDGVKTYDKYVVNKGTTKDINLEAVLAPNTDTAYKVEHYLMDLNGNYTIEHSTLNLTGTTNETVIPEVKNIVGFTSPTPKQLIIKPDGTSTIRYEYERNKYTVEINKSTGVSSVTGEGEYYFEEEVNIKVEYEEGYEFDNWSNGIETSNFVYKVPSKNETLKINAKPITYSIKYNLNGGTVNGVNREEFTVETNTFEIINPTKTGYTFVGWSDGVKTYDKCVVNKGTIEDINLEAIFTPNTNTTYTVEHYLMDLNGNYTIEHSTLNLTGTTNETVIPEVKNIVGFTSPTPKQLIIKPDGTSTIRYEYERNKYTVEINKSTGVSSVTGEGTYYFEEEVNIKVEYEEGYEFDNWSNGIETSNFVYKVPSKNETLKINAKPITYSIKYNLNGGTVNGVNREEFTVETETFEIINPTKTGYTFVGWSDGVKTFDKYVVNKGTTGNVNLEAIFTPNTDTIYTVKYYLMDKYGNFGEEATKIETRYGTSDETVIVDLSSYDGFKTPVPIQTKINPDGKTVVEYKYERNKYTVEINKSTGVSSVTGEGTYYFEEEVNIKVEYKNGYEFDNWSNGTETSNFVYKVPSKNETLKINAKPIIYSIKYNLNGGTVNGVNREEFTVETDTFEIINPTKTGYTFVGWSDGVKTYDKYVVNKGITKDINLEAIYEINTYKITYNLNGGIVNGVNRDEYTVETETFEIINPTKTGYTFVGWSDGVKTYDKYVVNKGTTKDINLEAVLAPNTDTAYKVEHYLMDLNGNYTIEHSTLNLTGTTNETVIPEVKNIEGFTSPTPKQLIIKPDGTSTIRYEYERNKYTVEINKSTGVSSVTGEGEYYFEEEVNIKVEYEEGYEFDNWSNGIETSDFVYKVSSKNETLKINAKPITYSIKYNLNGGIVTGTNLEEFTVETNTFEIINPTKTGYTFVGWSDGVKTYDKYVVNKGTTGKLNLEAIFTPNTYKIKYHGNSNTHGTMTESTHTYGVSSNLNNIGYEKKYIITYNLNYDTTSVLSEDVIKYEFSGWSRKNNGEVEFSNKAIINSLTDVNGETINLYAIWKYKNTSLKTPTRKGYAFAGWSTTSDGKNIINSSYVIKSNITLYAVWKVVPVIESLTFNVYNDSSSSLNKYNGQTYFKGDGTFYLMLPTNKYIDINSFTFKTNVPITLNTEATKVDANSTGIIDIVPYDADTVKFEIPGVTTKYYDLKHTDSTKLTWTVSNNTPVLQGIQQFLATLKSKTIGIAKNFGLTSEGVGSEHLISTRKNINGNEYLFFRTESTPLVKVEYIRIIDGVQTVSETISVPSGSLTPNLGNLKESGYLIVNNGNTYWYTDPSLTTPYDFNKYIYSNVKLYAKYVLNENVDMKWYTDNPNKTVFSICTKEELYGFAAASKKTDFKGKTIELNCPVKFNANEEWIPIDTFAGTFEGNGNIISNLQITTDTNTKVGFFRNLTNTAKVQNLVFDKVKISKSNADNVGTVAASMDGAKIYRVLVKDANITGLNRVAGIVGSIKGTSSTPGIVKECAVIKTSSSNLISGGSTDVGGVVGIASGVVELTDLYNDINVKAGGDKAQDVGGILSNYTNGTNNLLMKNVLFTGKVSPNTKCGLTCSVLTIGAIYGRIDDGQISLWGNDSYSNDKNSNKSKSWFYDKNTIGLTYDTYLNRGTGKTTTELKTASTFSSSVWNRDIWVVEDRVSSSKYPMLKWIVDANLN